MALILALCLSTVLRASGAPQHPNLLWAEHPLTNIGQLANPNWPIRPNWPIPTPEMDPNFFGPMPPQHHLLNRQAFPDDFNQADPFLDSDVYLDEFRQNSRECDPKHWNRRSCSDSNTVRTCTVFGTYRYTQCPSSWSCAQGLGICLRPFRQQFTTRRGFTCPEFAGTYPDPHTCKAYHVCANGSNSTPETVHCHWPQVYDPISQSCQMDTPDTPCYRIKCFGQRTVAYPGDPTVYANCTRPGIVQGLSRCNNGSAYNETSMECDILHYCTKEGNIPGPSPYQYYTCSRVFRRLIRSDVKTCPGDLQFNATVGICAGNSTGQNGSSMRFGDEETLNHWTTEELIRALQESAFILKEEDDPEVAGAREKRVKRGYGGRLLDHLKAEHQSTVSSPLSPFGKPTQWFS